MKKRKNLILVLILLLLVCIRLTFGESAIFLPDVLLGKLSEIENAIFYKIRLVEVGGAIFCGISLSIAGLLMQTVFRNPLAGPYVSGVSAGSSACVAVVVLSFSGGFFQTFQSLSLVSAAFIGAMLVILVLLFFMRKVNSPTIVLLVGVMIGYFAGAISSFLTFFSSASSLQDFSFWNLGSFGRLNDNQLLIFGLLSILTVLFIIPFLKNLTIMLSGDEWAMSCGIDTKQNRRIAIVIAGMLTAYSTAFCGPVAFIGIAVPHLIRILYKSNDLNVIFFGCCIGGACFALFISFVASAPWSSHVFPINAIASFIGAPIVVAMLIKSFKNQWTIS